MSHDEMVLHCEVEDLAEGGKSNNADAIIASIRDITKLRGSVQFASKGSLPNDGRLIVDLRSYD